MKDEESTLKEEATTGLEAEGQAYRQEIYILKEQVKTIQLENDD